MLRHCRTALVPCFGCQRHYNCCCCQLHLGVLSLRALGLLGDGTGQPSFLGNVSFRFSQIFWEEYQASLQSFFLREAAVPSHIACVCQIMCNRRDNRHKSSAINSVASSKKIRSSATCFLHMFYFVLKSKCTDNYKPLSWIRSCQLTTKHQARSKSNPCGIFGGQSGKETSFSPSTLFRPCKYHFTNNPYTVIQN
jgi:hypothetical protein